MLDFRPVLRSRETMGYIIAYAGHGAELFAMRSWIVPFLVFCLGSGRAFELDATLFATLISFVAVVSSIGGAELALRIGRARLITWRCWRPLRSAPRSASRRRCPLRRWCSSVSSIPPRSRPTRRHSPQEPSPPPRWAIAAPRCGAFDAGVWRVAVRAGAGGRGSRSLRAAGRDRRVGSRVPHHGIDGAAELRLLHPAAPASVGRVKKLGSGRTSREFVYNYLFSRMGWSVMPNSTWHFICSIWLINMIMGCSAAGIPVLAGPVAA